MTDPGSVCTRLSTVQTFSLRFSTRESWHSDSGSAQVCLNIQYSESSPVSTRVSWHSVSGFHTALAWHSILRFPQGLFWWSVFHSMTLHLWFCFHFLPVLMPIWLRLSQVLCGIYRISNLSCRMFIKIHWPVRSLDSLISQQKSEISGMSKTVDIPFITNGTALSCKVFKFS